jgi:hypothetical protein
VLVEFGQTGADVHVHGRVERPVELVNLCGLAVLLESQLELVVLEELGAFFLKFVGQLVLLGTLPELREVLVFLSAVLPQRETVVAAVRASLRVAFVEIDKAAEPLELGVARVLDLVLVDHL